MAHDVFVCYSSEDKTIANAACAKLESAGVRCWIAPRDPIAGIPYGRQLVDAIGAARVVLLIFSGHANRSEHVLRELEIASDSGKIIVPFRIEDIVPSGDLRYYITRVHWLDAMSPPMEARLNELVALMQRLLEMPIAPVAAVTIAKPKSRTRYPVVAAIAAIVAAIAIASGLYVMRRSAPPAVKVAKAAATAKPVQKKTAATHAPAIVVQATPRIVYVTAPPGPPVAIPPRAVSTKKPSTPKKTTAPKPQVAAKPTPQPTVAPTPEPTIASRAPTSLEYRTPRGGSFFIRHPNEAMWRVGRGAYALVGRTNVSGTAGTALMAPSGREWLFVPDVGAAGPYAHQVCFSLAGPGVCDANKIFPIIGEQ
jgi:hypothetical protein